MEFLQREFLKKQDDLLRLLSFTLLKKRYNDNGTGIAYGIGHGGMEAILLGAMSGVSNVVTSLMINSNNQSYIQKISHQVVTVLCSTPSYQFIYPFIERLPAFIIQVMLSIIVWEAVKGEKYWLYPLAIGIHAFVDVPAVLAQVGWLTNPIILYGILYLVTGVLVLCINKVDTTIKNTSVKVSINSRFYKTKEGFCLFVSHFSKWDWFKIYSRWYLSYQFKYGVSKKRKKLVFISFVIFLSITLLLSKFLIFTDYLEVFLMFIIGFLSLPSTMLLAYSPKKAIYFYEIPSKEEQENVSTFFKQPKDSNFNVSLNFNRNILLDGKTYKALIETKIYFIVYGAPPAKNQTAIYAINKDENRALLDSTEKPFLDLLLPKCEIYIKTN